MCAGNAGMSTMLWVVGLSAASSFASSIVGGKIE